MQYEPGLLFYTVIFCWIAIFTAKQPAISSSISFIVYTIFYVAEHDPIIYKDTAIRVTPVNKISYLGIGIDDQWNTKDDVQIIVLVQETYNNNNHAQLKVIVNKEHRYLKKVQMPSLVVYKPGV